MMFENKVLQKTLTALWITAEYVAAFLAYYVLMTVIGGSLLGHPYSFDLFFFLRFIALAFSAGGVVALVNQFLIVPLTAKLNFLWSFFAGVVLYVCSAFAGLFVYILAEHLVISVIGSGYSDLHAALQLFLQIEFLPMLFFLCMISLPIRNLHLLVIRVGEKNILNALFDRYRVPHEEERIFMFMDLYGSTPIAEKLGHARYHDLLYNVFNDISDLISRYSGEVYQYVGDAVIVTWDITQGTKKMNCVRCFFAIQNKMSALSGKYRRLYGYQPQFKAGMHVGKVIAGEVGDLKKEIVYHGDTVNTASRIQAECIHLHQHLLVSEELFMMFPVNSLQQVHTEFLGCLKLKGRAHDVCLYAVKK